METTSSTAHRIEQYNQEMSTRVCLSHRSPLCLPREKGVGSGWGNSGGLASVTSKSWHGAWPVLQGQVGRGTQNRGTGVGKDLEKQKCF